MPDLQFEFFQPYREGQPAPTEHEWRFVPEINVAPGYGHSWPIDELDNRSGLDCSETWLYEWCEGDLFQIDQGTGIGIPAPPSEIEACVSDNLFQCHSSTVAVPEEPGWVSVRACGDAADCSQWSKSRPLIEPTTEAVMWLVVLTGFLANAVWQKIKG